MGYATITDYEERYGVLGESARARITAQLADADLKVAAFVGGHGIDAASKAAVLRAMECEYVHYRQQFAVGSNVSAVTHQAGSFMETYSMRTELGFDKWASRYFGDVLGISRGVASSVKVAIHDSGGDCIDW